ncbi:MAG: cytidyltransferase [Thermodesulfobacteriota bacterium]|nr:cytidyltransferase [Thermodesulfobacteriota bacterium]
MNIAMIPARMGSQRLKRKNLRQLAGAPLITHAIRKCLAVGLFDQVWVNSEHVDFGKIARSEGVDFHRRPEHLGANQTTSEEYIAEFLHNHECDYLFQVHSIAPLLSVEEIRRFVESTLDCDCDVMLGCEPIQIECAFKGKPVNFSFSQKTNSQDLKPVQRICWSISSWRRETYLEAISHGQCATYTGKVCFHPLNCFASHVIKTEQDLRIAEALLPLVEGA